MAAGNTLSHPVTEFSGIPAYNPTMRIQWGSCSPSGVLVLNPNLIKAPRECVDYVILHEVCHLKEHNHSQKFYRLLSEMMPDWERHKTRLDALAEALLND
jgi:predicted metal-dependent hydrolase